MSEIQINDTEKNGGENKAGHIGSVNSSVKNCKETTSELRKFAQVMSNIKSMFDDLEIYSRLKTDERQKMEKELCTDVNELTDHYYELGRKSVRQELKKILGIEF